MICKNKMKHFFLLWFLFSYSYTDPFKPQHIEKYFSCNPSVPGPAHLMQVTKYGNLYSLITPNRCNISCYMCYAWTNIQCICDKEMFSMLSYIAMLHMFGVIKHRYKACKNKFYLTMFLQIESLRPQIRIMFLSNPCITGKNQEVSS